MSLFMDEFTLYSSTIYLFAFRVRTGLPSHQCLRIWSKPIILLHWAIDLLWCDVLLLYLVNTFRICFQKTSSKYSFACVAFGVILSQNVLRIDSKLLLLSVGCFIDLETILDLFSVVARLVRTRDWDGVRGKIRNSHPFNRRSSEWRRSKSRGWSSSTRFLPGSV